MKMKMKMKITERNAIPLTTFVLRLLSSSLSDLNEELSNMKQLLKDIVKQMTEDLVDKSLNSSRSDRVIFPSPPRPSSQISVRSSLCNQNELIDQYQKILSVVNTVPTHSTEQQRQKQQDDQEERKGTFDDISVSQVSFAVLQIEQKNRTSTFQRLRQVTIEQHQHHFLSVVSNLKQWVNVHQMEWLN